ncbi:hypothetical protein D3C76_555500 [compost metagenome]
MLIGRVSGAFTGGVQSSDQRQFPGCFWSVRTNLSGHEYYFRDIDTSPWGCQPAPGRTLTLGVRYQF